MRITDIQQIIFEQYPQYATMRIVPVEQQGHDNRTYRLGETMLIRLPSSAMYAEKIPIEFALLNELAPHLSFTIPKPLYLCPESKSFPYPFAIYKWLEGKSLNTFLLNGTSQLTTLTPIEIIKLANNLARCLNELHAIKTEYTLLPGQHNWWRGDHIRVYNQQALEQIEYLAHIVDSKTIDALFSIWYSAMQTKWQDNPVWVHGDIATGNLLLNKLNPDKNNQLTAIIDFGCSAMGDPACDLVMAWTFFKHEAQQIFMENINQSSDVWLRAKAWAIWKATFEISQLKDKMSVQAKRQLNILDSIIKSCI